MKTEPFYQDKPIGKAVAEMIEKHLNELRDRIAEAFKRAHDNKGAVAELIEKPLEYFMQYCFRPTELKPCPFCGGEAEMIGGSGGSYWLVCSGCSICSPMYNTSKAAIEAWNRRV
jgi:Lar family restriction alleviation protein